MKPHSPWAQSIVLLIIIGALAAIPILTTSGQETTPRFKEKAVLGRGTADDVAWRPDGQAFVVAGTRGLWIYNTQMHLLQHIDATNLRAAAWSPDESQIASVGGRTVKEGYNLQDSVLIWDVASASLIHTLFTQEQNAWLTNLAWNPDGRRIAVSGSGGLWVYDAESAALISTLKGPGALAWSPDGKLLATIYNTLSIHAENGALISNLPVTNIYEISWSQDGQMLALARASSYGEQVYDNTLQIWGIDHDQPLLVIQAGEVISVDWSPDGQRIASGTATIIDPNFFQVWNPSNGMLLAKLFAGNAPGDNGTLILRPVIVRWAPDSQHLLAAGGDNSVRLWSIPKGDAVHSVEEGILVDHSGPVNALAFSPDGQTIASGGDDGALRLWPTAGTGPARLVTTSAGKVRGLTWSPSGKFIAMSTTGLDTEYQVIDARTLEVVDQNSVEFTYPGEGGEGIELGLNMIGFNADETQVLWASQGNQAGIEDFTNDTTAATFSLSKSSFPAMAWSPDGKTLAGFERWQKGIVLWDSSGKQLLCLGCPLENAIVYPIVWSPDSQQVAGVYNGGYAGDQGILVWNAASGALVTKLVPEYEPILAISLNKDGLISIMVRDEVRIRDISSGKLLATLNAPNALSAAWNADGDQLAIGASDGTITIWESY